jgi:hypothetical protein
MLTAVPLPGFTGGLNLRDAAEVVPPNQAIDLLNVDFTAVGALRARPGYARFGSYDLPGVARSLGYYAASDSATRQLVVGSTTALRVLDSGGARIAAGDLVRAGGPQSFARLGGVVGDVLVAANGLEPMARWGGSGWATTGYSGLVPDGKFVCATPSGRLAMAGFPAAGTEVRSPSTVIWSDPYTPLLWNALNYEVFTPGDGEDIQGVCAWRELTFVFKRRKFFVVPRESPGAGGLPSFAPTAVVAGQGLVAPNAFAVAREGVYFMSRDGIYLTDGGPPVPVSAALEPLFTGRLSRFYGGVALNDAAMANVRAAAWNGRIYFAVPTRGTENDLLLVYDPALGAWTIHAIACSALLAFMPDSFEDELVFGLGANQLGRQHVRYTDDLGQPIRSRWLGGWQDFGQRSEKVVRELEVWGEGTVDVGLCVDYGGTPRVSKRLGFDAAVSDFWGGGAVGDNWGAGAGPDTWGGRRDSHEKRMRRSARGTFFAVSLVASAAPWTIYRLTYHPRLPEPVPRSEAA